MFDWFVEHYGADLSPQNDAGETPLMIAAKEGRIEIIRFCMAKYPE